MARVRTFRIHPKSGIPDHEIQDFLTKCEREGIMRVGMIYIPPLGEADPRLTVTVTKLDDLADTVDQDYPRAVAGKR